MKSKSSISKVFALKTLFICICIIAGFAGFIKCDAQSVVGKWKRTGTRFFITDKASGKQTPVSDQMQRQYDEASAARGYTELLELKSNNTYTSTVSATGMKSTEHTENYSLSGNILDMNIPPVNKEKTTITIKSIDATTMVWDMVFMGKLTEIIYTRM